MIYDRIQNFKKYPFGEVWDEAFQFILSLDAQSDEKRYELSNGMYAIVMSYKTKNPKAAVLESHRKYVDIQATISGAEGIEWYNRSDLTVSEDYSEKKDVVFYKWPGGAPAFTKNLSGAFTALWPDDAHMPQLLVDDFEWVKKVVVKVPVSLL